MIRRRRWIQPEFFTSEDVLALPRDARLTFIGLWLYADDFGRERTNAALIKADVYPLDEDITPRTIDEHMLLFEGRDMIRLYEVAGREYFELTGWNRWQPVQNPSRSNIPAPSADEACHEPPAPPSDPYVEPLETPRSEGEGEEREGEREEGDREAGDEGTGEAAPTTHLDSASTSTTRPPDPFCPRHPGGTSKPCRDCGNARMTFKHWQAAQMAAEEAS